MKNRAASVGYVTIGWLTLFSSVICASEWPQFRGPGARGVCEGPEGQLPTHWSATKNVAWKTEIPGRGWSSPVVWGNRVVITTVVNTGTSEEPKKGLYFGGNRPTPPESLHQWKVLCLDLESGKILWERQVHEGVPETARHLKNSYASETPVADASRVYCLFGNLGLFCFDWNGNELWKHEIKPHKMRFGWGTAASPALYEGRLYLVNDNDEESYLLALDAETGVQVWRTPRDEKSNWSTPFIWKNSLRTEIITAGTGKVRSNDLEGQLLWELEGMSSITIATPYAVGDLLYLSSGYVMAPFKPIYAIRPGATGDISLPAGETSSQWIAWCQPKAAPYNPSTLVYRDRLYALYDMGLFACFDAHQGTEVYSRQRIPRGRAFTASPWAYDDKIFCLNEDGVTYVLQAGDEFKLLHTNSLANDDMCMATPAIVEDRLLIRTAARVYCIRQGADAAPQQ